MRFGPWLGPLIALSVGCSPNVPTEPQPARARAAIIGGELDLDNDAVVRVDMGEGLCSGTIIAVTGNVGVVLTAAHCLVAEPQRILIGDDARQARACPVLDWKVHPSFPDPVEVSSGDFMLMRFSGASPDTPIISPLTPMEDEYGGGEAVEHSGFGVYNRLDPCPEGEQEVDAFLGDDGDFHHICLGPQRRRAFSTIASATPATLEYEQNFSDPGPEASGVCSGDSGGPQLVATASGKRVLSVNSTGVLGCNGTSASGRVSNVFEGFVEPFIAETKAAPDAPGCIQLGDPGGGGAGGTGGAPVTDGAGGGGGTADEDTRPDNEGAIVTTGGCQLAHDASSSPAGLLPLALAIAGLRLRLGGGSGLLSSRRRSG